MRDAEYPRKIKEFLMQLDSPLEQTSEIEISSRIREFTKEFGQNPPAALFFEQFAFDFIEDYPRNKGGWGTYFGPLAIFNKEYPDIKEITPKTIEYWKRRIGETTHPILKARYSDLVWDFSEKISGEKPHYSIAQIFADSVMEIAEKDLHKDPVNVIKKLERALSLLLAINDKRRIEKIKKVIISYENKIAEDDKPGLWGFSYNLLVKDKKIQLSGDEETEIIRSLEQRFERLLNNRNIEAAKKAAILLADYYKRKRPEKVKDILLDFGNIFQQVTEQASAIMRLVWLTELHNLYLQHGLKDEADKILIKIKELGGKSISELKEIKVPEEISKKEIDNFINKLTEGDLETALKRTISYFIPRRNNVIKQLEEISKEASIYFCFTKEIQDSEGRMVATLKPLQDDREGNIVFQISQNMNIECFLLEKVIDVLIQRFNLNEEVIVSYLYTSPIFEDKRRVFLIRGIKAYLDRDFLTALHILIPQIESLIRSLAEKLKVPVLKPSQTGGFHYRLLDDLLRDENLIKVLGEDMCLYLRVLLTDPRGWNLRNEICHGISPLEAFNRKNSDRIFHALLCLSLVREHAEPSH